MNLRTEKAHQVAQTSQIAQNLIKFQNTRIEKAL